MQTLVERFKNYFGFEFGFERFTEKAINVKFARNEAARAQKSWSSQNILHSTTTSAILNEWLPGGHQIIL